MRKFVIRLYLVFQVGVAGAFLSQAAGSFVRADPIVIGIIGDQTGSADLEKSYAVLEQGVEKLNSVGTKPDVVLHVGDLVESKDPETIISERFRQASAILNKLSSPWYLSPGDHDVNPPVFDQDSQDRSREQLFQKLYSSVNPLVSQKLYYSFEVKNWHFVALNSVEHLHTDPRWGKVFYDEISDEQFAWLERDLQTATAAGRDGIVVFTHHPMWYNWTGWQRAHELLRRFPVKVVIAGHTHYNQADAKLDGIQYWIVGSTGADTKSGSENAGHLFHVTTLSLSETSVDFKLLPLTPFTQSAWTDRAVMDKAHALDVILGNGTLYSFDRAAMVYLENGQLTGKCGASVPATIAVPDVGNALAEPVKVTVALDSPSAMLSSGAFAPNFCETAINEYSCSLASSAGVVMSNNSTVALQQFPLLPPLWGGTVIAKNSRLPAVGDPLTLKLTMGFTESNAEYEISTIGSSAVKACP